jgi:hypothetical protein
MHDCSHIVRLFEPDLHVIVRSYVIASTNNLQISTNCQPSQWNPAGTSTSPRLKKNILIACILLQFQEQINPPKRVSGAAEKMIRFESTTIDQSLKHVINFRRSVRGGQMFDTFVLMGGRRTAWRQ